MNSKKLRTHKSSTFNFVLTDENENVIDTKGININFTIMIFKSNVKGFIKYLTFNDSTPLNIDQNNILGE